MKVFDKNFIRKIIHVNYVGDFMVGSLFDLRHGAFSIFSIFEDISGQNGLIREKIKRYDRKKLLVIVGVVSFLYMHLLRR